MPLLPDDSSIAALLRPSAALRPVISLLIGAFSVGLSVGANVAIAIRIGHGRMDLVKNAVQTTAVLTLVCGALLTVVGMLITGPILDAIGMPAEATEEAAWYLRIYFAGSVFFLAYNFGSAVLRAKGDTRRPCTRSLPPCCSTWYST